VFEVPLKVQLGPLVDFGTLNDKMIKGLTSLLKMFRWNIFL
jgi:hypothetical protein